MVYENKEGYCYFKGEPSGIGKRVTLTVTVMLDPVMGYGHVVEDHVASIMRHPYVQSIKVEK